MPAELRSDHDPPISTGKRAAWIDMARGLSIALVVLGHTGAPSVLVTPFSAFRLPLFFLLAGLTFRDPRPGGRFGVEARARAKRLLRPYVVFGLLSVLLWYVGWHYGMQTRIAVPPSRPMIGLVYANATNAGWMVPNVALWFLPALFCALLSLSAVVRAVDAWERRRVRRAVDGAGRTERAPPDDPRARTTRELAAVLALALAGYALGRVIFLPWSADAVLVMLPFLYVGLLLARLGRRDGGAALLPPAATLAALAVVAAAVAVNGRVSVAGRRFGLLPLFYAGGVAGALLVCEVVRRLRHVTPMNALLSRLGRQSLAILVFHILAFKAISMVALFVFHRDPRALDDLPWHWLVQWTLGIGLSLLGAAACRRVPALRAVLYPSEGAPPPAAGAPGPRGRLAARRRPAGW